MWDVVWDGVTTQADYVHNPTIVGFSFSSPTSLRWEVSKTETLSILRVHLVYVDVKTLLQREYILVGLLDAQWGRSAQKSHIFMRRSRLNTENPTTAHNTQQQGDTMPGNVRHGLCRRPWPSGVRSGSMRLLATSWATPGMLGFFSVVLGAELSHFFISAF
jgi:hypothetical protein